MPESRQYEFGKSRLALIFGDMLTSTAEVLVSSDDYRLSMGGGISRAILAAAGNSLALDARKSGERKAGEVVVTSAGALSARYVFHVITIGPGGSTEADLDVRELVKRATVRCLDLLQSLGVSSIAFPALGTGAAGFSMNDSASAMAEVIAQYLSKLEVRCDVSIYLYSRWGQSYDYMAFYEEFARRAPTVGGAPASALREPDAKPIVKSLALSLEAERQQLEQSLAELIDMGGNPAYPRVLDELLPSACHVVEQYGNNPSPIMDGSSLDSGQCVASNGSARPA